MFIRNTKLTKIIFLALFIGVLSLSITPVLADETPVKALGKITLKSSAEEAGLKSFLTKIGGRILGYVGAALELFWPDTSTNAIFINSCVGETDCQPPSFGNTEGKSITLTEPASYVIKWNVLEKTAGTRCSATTVMQSLVYPPSYFESLPPSPAGPLPQNPSWSGNWAVQGEAHFSGRPAGVYAYQLVCYNPATGNDFTKVIDGLTVFGGVTKPSYYVQDVLWVTIRAKEKKYPAFISVNLTANKTTVRTGEKVTLSAYGQCNNPGAPKFYFYCDRNDAGLNITPTSLVFDKSSGWTGDVDISQSTNGCFYYNQGTYTAKVIVQQGGESAEDRITINVIDAPFTDLNVNNQKNVTINQGEPVTLSWSSTNNPISCTASGGWNNSKPVANSPTYKNETVTPTTTSTYSLQCANAGGAGNRADVTVNVLGGSAPSPAPQVDLRVKKK